MGWSFHCGALASFFMCVCAFVFLYVHVWRPEVSLGCHSSCLVIRANTANELPPSPLLIFILEAGFTA